MNELSQKFNLYDHLAYILVGFYQICVLFTFYILATQGNFNSLIDFLRLEFTVALVLGSYLVGHLVQAVSNIFEKWEKKKKEEKKKNLDFIMVRARQFFALPETLSEKDLWQYCYLYALSNDFSGHITLFNSIHSLYRGFWIASAIGFIGSAFIFIKQIVLYFVTGYAMVPDWKILLFAVATLLLAILFNRRKKRFFEYMGEKTLITFDILSKNILNNK